MELLDLVDENNNFIGKNATRDEVHKKGLWHREVMIIVINKKNEILLQKRTSNKKLAPNMWSLTAGHISSGESADISAIRETQEELGIQNLKKDDFNFLSIQKCASRSRDIINNHFKYLFSLKTNLKIDEFQIEKNELSEVKYFSIDELKNIHANSWKFRDEYTQIFFYEYFLDILNALE